MGSQSARPVVFDAGALIALERGNPFVRQLLREIVRLEGRVYIPAPVVGQVWRHASRQVLVAAVLKRREVTVVPLDEEWAKACGLLLGQQRGKDVIDAMVVMLARKVKGVIVTSDPDDLRHLDPKATVYPV